ncbi:MAG: PH domain-containing protein [Oscillospiraceae bacterium]|nr:PH domain-containing protein [Oscillospiraceae bacterium]
MKFKSKVDWWIHVSFALMPIITIWFIIDFIISPSISNGIFACLFLIINIIIVPWWFNTHYILNENELIIKLGGLGKGTKIAYSAITSVKETREPWASAALSIDRIEIIFKTGKTGNAKDVIYISPKDKQEFLSQLEQRRLKG